VKFSVDQDDNYLSCIPAIVESNHDLQFRPVLIPLFLSQAKSIKSKMYIAHLLQLDNI